MKVLVIKLGTSSLFDESTMDTRLANIAQLVEMAVKLQRQHGYRVCFVSSGGIAAGLQRMRMKQRPKTVTGVQAMAAIGQCRLMAIWEQLFNQFEQPVAQVLLTRTDIADRIQYRNACAALKELLEQGVVPIVNENDTLTSREARFGDNDTLSAVVAGMIGATHLFLMTDVSCLYTANPRLDPEAKPIHLVSNVSAIFDSVSTAGTGSGVGTGGMTTKLIAATLATSVGISMFIVNSDSPTTVSAILDDEEKGVEPQYSKHLYTKFAPGPSPGHLRDRAFWLLHSLTTAGKIYVDEGAYHAVTRRDRAGLLPVGVTRVEGNFHQEQCVEIVCGGKTVGRCLVNYSSSELKRIKGIQSSEITKVLGYADSEYVAFRDNLAFFPTINNESEPPTKQMQESSI